jgi:hypothetical protein
MKVQLISYSKTSYSKTSYSKTAFTGERESEDTLQDLVAYCARVSNPANQHNKETNEKLIHYLITPLRSGNGTQKEHKDVAIACASAIHTIFPMINEFISE